MSYSSSETLADTNSLSREIEPAENGRPPAPGILRLLGRTLLLGSEPYTIVRDGEKPGHRGFVMLLVIIGLVVLAQLLGFWLGAPTAPRLDSPTLVERFDGVIEDVSETVAAVAAAVESTAAAIEGQIEEAIDTAAAEFDRRFGGVIAQAGAIFDRFAGPQMRLTRLLEQRTVTVSEIEAVVAQAPPTPAQMSQLLARAGASESDTQRLLRLAGLTAEQLAAARAAEQAQLDATMAELQPLLDQIGMSPSEFEAMLAQVPVTPVQVNDWIKALSTTPAAVGSLLARIKATPERLNELVAQARGEVVKIEPMLGERPSRVIRLGGAWLASPLHYASSWMFFVLLLLVVAKSVGGRATVNQHLGAAALSAAPSIFFLFAYAPDMSSVLTAPSAAALHTTGRILALIGVLWCGALLLKAVGVAHGFGMWKSIGVVLLTWVALYIVAPLAVALAAGFLVR